MSAPICHDLLMMSMNLSDIVILNNKGSDYCCIIRAKKAEHCKTPKTM